MNLYLVNQHEIKHVQLDGQVDQARLRTVRRVYVLNRRRLIKSMPGAGNHRSITPYNGSGHACSRIGRAKIPMRGMVVSAVPNAVGGRKGHQDPSHKVRLRFNKRQKKSLIDHAWRAWVQVADVFVIKEHQTFSRTREIERYVKDLMDKMNTYVNPVFATEKSELYAILRNMGHPCVNLAAPDLYLLTTYAPRRAIFIFSAQPPVCLGL